jgi:hypothetical protein
VVDVEQHRVEAPPVAGEAGRVRAAGEEVAVDEPAAGVAGQRRGVGQQPAPVPGDHLVERLHHDQRPHPVVRERGAGGVAEAEAADHHVEVGAVQGAQREVGQRDLGDREQAGHQELVAQLDLVHLDVERRLAAAAQADLAHRRRLPGELFEAQRHRAILPLH